MAERLLELVRAYNAAVKDVDAVRATRDRLAVALDCANDELVTATDRQKQAQRALLLEAGQD
jgi:hypothetical protein